MANYKSACENYLDRQGIKYTEVKDNVLRIVYNADNMNSIKILVIFDKDGDDDIAFRCFEITPFKDREAAGMVVCNELNNQYRWVKFCIDKDSDIVCEADAIVDMDSVGPEVMRIVKLMVNIVDKAYPTIMKYKFGD